MSGGVGVALGRRWMLRESPMCVCVWGGSLGWKVAASGQEMVLESKFCQDKLCAFPSCLGQRTKELPSQTSGTHWSALSGTSILTLISHVQEHHRRRSRKMHELEGGEEGCEVLSSGPDPVIEPMNSETAQDIDEIGQQAALIGERDGKGVGREGGRGRGRGGRGREGGKEGQRDGDERI